MDNCIEKLQTTAELPDVVCKERPSQGVRLALTFLPSSMCSDVPAGVEREEHEATRLLPQPGPTT